MRTAACALVLALAACGGSEEPKAKPQAKPAAKPAGSAAAPAVKSDPNGKHLCIACKIRTNDTKCPACGTVLKAETEGAPAHKPSGAVGKSAVAALYACPKEGCTYTEAKKNTCLKHADTTLVEQWFTCAACSKKEPVAGKCAGCGADLKRTLQ